MNDIDSTTLNNRLFYDVFAPSYEKADGRRKRVPKWLRKIIAGLARQHPKGSFLDLGAGTGYIAKIAADYFSHVVAVDVSERMLGLITDPRIFKKVGSACEIPYPEEYFDVVCTFSLLHHIEHHRKVFHEIKRVLKYGGTYYSDHDIEELFVKRYWWMVKAYRTINDPIKRLSKASGLPHGSGEYLKDTFKDVELHQDGISGNQMEYELDHLFMDTHYEYHWQGLLPFNKTYPKRGKAPLMRIYATK